LANAKKRIHDKSGRRSDCREKVLGHHRNVEEKKQGHANTNRMKEKLLRLRVKRRLKNSTQHTAVNMASQNVGQVGQSDENICVLVSIDQAHKGIWSH